MKFRHYILFLCTAAVLYACKHFKPKPVSDDVTKTTVTINGKKDSVINNPQKNYGNATISSICVKCALRVIQNTDSYKQIFNGITPRDINYNINWITSKQPIALGASGRVINGLLIAVYQKTGLPGRKPDSYVYNNADAGFYFKSSNGSYSKILNIDSAAAKKVRNSCFWGVASSR